MPTSTPCDKRPEDYATAWFAVLERARLTHDAKLEVLAVERLRRLGVRVDFIERPRDGGQSDE